MEQTGREEVLLLALGALPIHQHAVSVGTSWTEPKPRKPTSCCPFVPGHLQVVKLQLVGTGAEGSGGRDRGIKKEEKKKTKNPSVMVYFIWRKESTPAVTWRFCSDVPASPVLPRLPCPGREGGTPPGG